MQSSHSSWTCHLCLFKEMPFADVDNLDNLNSTDTNSFFLESSLNELNVSKEKAADTMTQVTDIKHIRNNNRKECIIASLNINSLPNKFEEIKEWLGSNLFDILAIQETKIDSTFPNSQFNVEGYKLFRHDRAKGGGGIVVFVRDNISAICKRHTSTSVELLLFDMCLGQRRFPLISAYKPPSINNSTFTKEMLAVLDKVISLCENVNCIGDLNCDLLNPLAHNKQGRCLMDICDIYDLDTLINTPTRISTNRALCLYVILTNVPAYMKDSGTIQTGLSDHNLVYTVIKTKL